MVVRFGSSSSINDSDETLRCELLPLSRVCLIEDGALKFFHVMLEEEASLNVRCLIFIERSR